MAATAALMSAGRALMSATASTGEAGGAAGGVPLREQLYCETHPATYDVPVDDVS